MTQRDAQGAPYKQPPHSFEAEQSVLGGLMLDNEAWDRVAELVDLGQLPWASSGLGSSPPALTA